MISSILEMCVNSVFMNTKIVFKNARIFNGRDDKLFESQNVVIVGDTITGFTDEEPEYDDDTEVIDCRGQILMPGMIDAHVHVYVSTINLARAGQSPFSYLAHYAAQFMKSSLDRGFTTLRDVGGADVGLATAIRDGLLGLTPRLFYGGRIISQTGGHGDFRPGDHALEQMNCCGCGMHSNALSVIADGPDEIRKAVREELRRGASHIKIMASGGVTSTTDPLDKCQYSDEEISIAVEEANRMGHYVAAHCHPAEAIGRAAKLGIRSIEHATLIDQEAADIVAEKNAFVVPTMAIGFTMSDHAETLGLPQVIIDKMRWIIDKTMTGLEVMKNNGLKMGFGTDLLGDFHVYQTREFTLRAEVLSAIDILRSACVTNAELLNQSDRLGCIRPGAAADLLLVKGNPLEDISVITDSENLMVIMKDGKFHKRTL